MLAAWFEGPIGSPWSSRSLGVMLVALKPPEKARTMRASWQAQCRLRAETRAQARCMEDLLYSLGKPKWEIQGTLPRGTTSDCKVCCTMRITRVFRSCMCICLFSSKFFSIPLSSSSATSSRNVVCKSSENRSKKIHSTTSSLWRANLRKGTKSKNNRVL